MTNKGTKQARHTRKSKKGKIFPAGRGIKIKTKRDIRPAAMGATVGGTTLGLLTLGNPIITMAGVAGGAAVGKSVEKAFGLKTKGMWVVDDDLQ